MYCFIIIASGLVAVAAAPAQDGHLTHQFQDSGRGRVQDLGLLFVTTLQEFFDGLAGNGFNPFEPLDQQVIDYSSSDGSLKVHGVFNGVCVTGLGEALISFIVTPPYYTEFEIAIPEINLRALGIIVELEYLDATYYIEADGWFVLQIVTASVAAVLNPPLSVDSANVGLTIEGVESHFTGTINGSSYTDDLNEFIKLVLQAMLTDFNSGANNTLNELVVQVLNNIVSSK